VAKATGIRRNRIRPDRGGRTGRLILKAAMG